MEANNSNTELVSPGLTSTPRACSPEKRILFLKTHKTGSSTITNIFFRYGDLRNLSFVLSDGTLLGWPKRFQLKFPRLLQSKAPNILCSHARFNQKPMNWLFPKQTSKYVTILRNPVDNFESVFRYMKLGSPLGVGNGPDSLQTFLENGVSFGKFKTVKASPLVRNPLLYDLGLSFKYYQNLTAVNEYIQFLDKEFDLVMIMDYFDESLVLMKRLLCWQMEDILYLKLNERQDKEKDTVLNDDVRENVKSWNKADVLLFEYFNKSFWRKIENDGESFYKELTIFRERKSEIKRACVTNETSLQRVYAGKLVKGYSIRTDLPKGLQTICEKMTISENSYLAYLRKKHDQGLEKEMEEDEETWDREQDLVYESVQPVRRSHGLLQKQFERP